MKLTPEPRVPTCVIGTSPERPPKSPRLESRVGGPPLPHITHHVAGRRALLPGVVPAEGRLRPPVCRGARRYVPLPFPGLLLTRQTRRAGSGCTPRRRSERTRCSSRARASWPCRRRRRAAPCRRSTPRERLTGGARACSSRRTSACTGCTRSGRRASESAVTLASCCALFCPRERRGSRSRAS